MNEPSLLFVYGTLGPRYLGGDRVDWGPDAVRGRLFDLGPYPGLVDLDDPTADWVEGDVRPTTGSELEGSLDTYEGVEEGRYRRVETRTRAGRHVWVYVYARSLPECARGPLTRWEGAGRALAAE